MERERDCSDSQVLPLWCSKRSFYDPGESFLAETFPSRAGREIEDKRDTEGRTATDDYLAPSFAYHFLEFRDRRTGCSRSAFPRDINEKREFMQIGLPLRMQHARRPNVMREGKTWETKILLAKLLGKSFHSPRGAK